MVFLAALLEAIPQYTTLDILVWSGLYLIHIQKLRCNQIKIIGKDNLT